MKRCSPDCNSSFIILFLELQINALAFSVMTKLPHYQKYSHLKKWDGIKKNQVNWEECSQPVAFVSLMYHQAQLEQSAEFKNVISVNNEPIKAINTE